MFPSRVQNISPRLSRKLLMRLGAEKLDTERQLPEVRIRLPFSSSCPAIAHRQSRIDEVGIEQVPGAPNSHRPL